MKKALKTTIRNLNKSEFSRLRSMCRTAKNLYNQALYLIRQEYEATGAYLNYYAMDRRMKTVTNLDGEVNYRLLKAGVSQQILRRLDQNYVAYFKALKTWKASPERFTGMPQPPKFLKDTANLIFDSQRFRVKDGRVFLEKDFSFALPRPLLGRKIQQIEVIPRHDHFDAVFVYEDGQTNAERVVSDVAMGIDLGLDNLATCATTTGKSLIINGKPLKSINQFYNKQKARLQAQIERRQHVKWSARLERLTDRRNRRVNDYLHKASRLIVEFARREQVGRVIVGNVAKSMNGIHLGKVTNQKFTHLPLGQLIDVLRYKLDVHGIVLTVTDESYTSKASFVDNDPLPEKYDAGKTYTFSGKRIYRGLYRTKAGLTMNADLVGAYNIIRKVVRGFSFEELRKRIAGRFSPHCQIVTCQ